MIQCAGIESANPRPIPLSADGHALTDSAQDFGALSDTKKHGTGNENDQKAETTRFELVVKIANPPPDALNPGAASILFVIH